MICLRSASYDYLGPQGAVRALQSVDLEIRRGERVCLLGANGSGKSTAALLCNALLVPTEGSVTVDGIDTSDPDRTWDIRSKVGLVLQDPDDQIVGATVEGDAAFGPENLGVAPEEIRFRVAQALDTVGLSEFAHREPHTLSEGQKQRLAIAGALTIGTDYLVLDEPTSMLDPIGRRDALSVIERLVHDGHGVLHITHRVDEAASADRVVVLAAGSVIFSGTTEELLADREILETARLERPPISRVVSMLSGRGVALDASAMTPEAVVEALWPSQ